MWFRKMLVAAAALVIPATAFAWHNHLTKSTPAADATVTEAPKEIRLWFAETVEPKFSSISLLTADSTKLEIGKARGTDDPLSIVADPAKPLSPGNYMVVWRTAGDDGHAVRGRFSFTVGK